MGDLNIGPPMLSNEFIAYYSRKCSASQDISTCNCALAERAAVANRSVFTRLPTRATSDKRMRLRRGENEGGRGETKKSFLPLPPCFAVWQLNQVSSFTRSIPLGSPIPSPIFAESSMCLTGGRIGPCLFILCRMTRISCAAMVSMATVSVLAIIPE